MTQKWNGVKITNWAQSQFGEPDINATAKRMKKEIAEFYDALECGDVNGAAEEIVDIEVMLRQCAVLLGVDLDKGVDEKMDINEAREWKQGADGDFQHV